MRNFLTIFFLIPLSSLPQSTSFDFHSPENTRKFADHLFCEGDYLRAIEQYNYIDNQFNRDTIQFKVMLGYSKLKLYSNSNEVLKRIPEESIFYSDAYLLSLKNKLLIEPKSLSAVYSLSIDNDYAGRINRLNNISMLYDDRLLITKEKFIEPFNEDESKTVSLYYDLKSSPPYKSPALAGILSAIIPGSGKMYVGEWGDGLTALAVTGLLAFLAYDNFHADHTTRAWIFTGLGAFFYAGNIYGSIASAQIFNARIDFEFNDGLRLFLEQKNYFLPEYDFCR
jgi:TM2 domain-containing membrane protein YozV